MAINLWKKKVIFHNREFQSFQLKATTSGLFSQWSNLRCVGYINRCNSSCQHLSIYRNHLNQDIKAYPPPKKNLVLCTWFDHNDIILSFVTDTNAAKCRTPTSVIFCQIEVHRAHPNHQVICTLVWNLKAAGHIETYRWCQWYQIINPSIRFFNKALRINSPQRHQPAQTQNTLFWRWYADMFLLDVLLTPYVSTLLLSFDKDSNLGPSSTPNSPNNLRPHLWFHGTSPNKGRDVNNAKRCTPTSVIFLKACKSRSPKVEKLLKWLTFLLFRLL